MTGPDEDTAQGRVVVVTGPPGVGKSTVSPLVEEAFDLSVWLHADDFFHYLRRGWIAPWAPESATQNGVVIAAVGAAAGRFAAGGYTVVVDGIVGPWFLGRIAGELPDGVPLSYVCLRPTLDTAVARATGRTGPDDLVDPEPVRHMYGELADLGELEAHVLDSTDLDAGETARRVVEGVEWYRVGR